MPQIAQGTDVYLGGGLTRVTRKSVFTGKEHTMELPVTPEQLYRWHSGTPIQDAMPQLSRTQREFLMTGTTEAEWLDHMGSDYDE